MRTTTKKIFALLLVACLAIAVMTGCQERGGSGGSTRRGSFSRERVLSDESVDFITPDHMFDVAKAYDENSDTVGWVEVPGTNIDDVVLHYPDDPTNNYYLRKGFDGEYSFNGVYYADYRSAFGDGTRDGLGVNTTIYGHAITDNPDETSYNVKFGQLHNFRDPAFAEQNPYIFFSTENENMVFEIIAVFYGNTDNPAFAYNHNPSGKDFLKTIENEVLPRSLFHYNVDFNDKDKFLTLSTCIYHLEDGTQLDYNAGSEYRFGVMAKLVDPDEPMVEHAIIEANEDLVVDPDGRGLSW